MSKQADNKKCSLNIKKPKGWKKKAFLGILLIHIKRQQQQPTATPMRTFEMKSPYNKFLSRPLLMLLVGLQTIKDI